MGITEFIQLSGTIGLTGAIVLWLLKEMFAVIRERRDRPPPDLAKSDQILAAIAQLNANVEALVKEGEANGKQLAFIQGQLSGK